MGSSSTFFGGVRVSHYIVLCVVICSLVVCVFVLFLVCPMLLVPLDCPLSIFSFVISYIYLTITVFVMDYKGIKPLRQN